MQIEGRLQIDLYPADEKVSRVSIQSSRPLQAAQIFTGKTPQEVLMQLPLLFSVCGIAQATAAAQAFQQALPLKTAGSLDTARELLVQMETAREHLLRILLDWPGMLGEPVAAQQAAPLQSMLQALRKALFADENAFSLQAKLDVDNDGLHAQIDRLDEILNRVIFDGPADDWLQMSSLDKLNDWLSRAESIAAKLLRHVSAHGWQMIGATSSQFLPEMTVEDLNKQLDSSAASQLIAEPMWQGVTCETTALTRQYDSELIQALNGEFENGLLTRLVARLVELARIPLVMRTLATQLDSTSTASTSSVLPAGIGIGQIEAARGRLVHRVVLEGEHVQRYQILAPTEWNFHPSGVVARGLAKLPVKDATTLRRQSAMLINAVDPCVGYDLQIH